MDIWTLIIGCGGAALLSGLFCYALGRQHEIAAQHRRSEQERTDKVMAAFGDDLAEIKLLLKRDA